MAMADFWASINRKKLLINVVGYLVILFLYLSGPRMEGFLGGAIRVYLMVFPAYYLGFLWIRYKAGRGADE